MKEYKFSNVIKLIEIVLTVVVILNFVISYYAVNKLNENSSSVILNGFSQDVDNLTNCLFGIHTMMLSEVGYDKDLDKLLVIDNYYSDIDAINIRSRIKGVIKNWSKELVFQVHYVIYYPNSGLIIENCEDEKDYDLWRTVKSEMLFMLDHKNFKADWNLVCLNEEFYVMDIVSNNGRYMLAYIKLEEILASLETEVYGEDYYVAVVNDQEQIYYKEKEMKKDDVAVSSDSNQTIHKNWLEQKLIVKESINNEISVILVIDDYNRLVDVFKIQMLLGVLIIFAVSMIIWILKFVNDKVLHPIHKFNKNMENLKNDETFNVETHYQINELGNASKLMSDMVKKIKNLKIHIYEKNMEQQKIKMDFLSLQIEPHFYLNCLNVIYSMAQMEQYKEIQRLSNCVSEFLRYIFKNRDTFTTVGEEVEHIKRYLEIQKIRYQDCFEARIEIEEEILKAELPPLILQTFVENSVKYTVNWEDEIEVSIRGKAGDAVIITIEDNGDGYAPEILYPLQNGIDISDGQNRIGIMNAISRMNLAFGSEAKFRFYNREEGGAGVEIRFPLVKH